MCSQAEQFLYTATAQIAAAERSIGETRGRDQSAAGKRSRRGCRAARLWNKSRRSAAALRRDCLLRCSSGGPISARPKIHLIAANAQIGAARALLFPQISLTGFLGGQSQALTSLLTGPARMASIAPSALAPIFHAGSALGYSAYRSATARGASLVSEDHFHGRCAKSPMRS